MAGMATYDASRADCRVFTYKDGALSAVAHDLEVRVGALAITVDDDLAIDATFEAGSLTVLHAVKDGQPSGALGAGDKKKIEKTIAGEVLDAARHPRITFRGQAVATASGYDVTGTLTLHGQARPVRLTARRDGERVVGELRLHQPDFGIKPFSAMFGTLKIKPDVRVVVSVPAPA
jgi:hypothetical protein